MEILGIYLGLSLVAGLISLVAVHFAPVGYEDETGFHYGSARGTTLPDSRPAGGQILPISACPSRSAASMGA